MRIPCTCAREKIGAASARIEACHKKITPQLRRKTSPRSSRCSASLEAEESDPEQPWKRLPASCGLLDATSHGTPRIPCTCERKKIGAAAVRIDACHKKFPPQLRRKISQRLRRCSAPCKPRWLIQSGALSVARKRDLSCALAIRAGNFYLCAPLSPAPPLTPPPFLIRKGESFR